MSACGPFLFSLSQFGYHPRSGLFRPQCTLRPDKLQESWTKPSEPRESRLREGKRLVASLSSAILDPGHAVTRGRPPASSGFVVKLRNSRAPWWTLVLPGTPSQSSAPSLQPHWWALAIPVDKLVPSISVRNRYTPPFDQPFFDPGTSEELTSVRRPVRYPVGPLPAYHEHQEFGHRSKSGESPGRHIADVPTFIQLSTIGQGPVSNAVGPRLIYHGIPEQPECHPVGRLPQLKPPRPMLDPVNETLRSVSEVIGKGQVPI